MQTRGVDKNSLYFLQTQPLVQSVLRIRIRVKDPDADQVADDKPKCIKYELIQTLFQGFELSFGS
jgi:hypothetical protein